MAICGIYKITNNLNGKSYIGYSIDIQRRWSQHKKMKYRASIYDAKTNYLLAISDYKTSLKYNPNQPVVNYLIAIDYDNLKNTRSALEYYKKVISVYDKDDEYSQYVKARIQEIEEDLKNESTSK